MGLLLLAGVAGMVFLLPASPVHAAGATVTLSTISSGVLTAVTTGQTVGTTLVISGSGFLANNPIAITSTVGTTTINWYTGTGSGTPCTATGFTSFAQGGKGTANSLVSGGCLTTQANGNFQTSVAIPAMPGGAESVVVTDGTNSVTTPFTVAAKVSLSVTTGDLNFGFPEQAVPQTLTFTGFGASETVTEASPAFTSTTTCSTSTVGSCSVTWSPVVADVNSGSKTLTGTGGTSGLVASTTFTVNPWAAFYNSANGQTQFSFLGQAPTSLVIEAHGLPAGTIASNSVTIGGAATSNSAVTVGASGTVYGMVVAPQGNVNFGPASVVIDGTTFSYALGNIVNPTTAAVAPCGTVGVCVGVIPLAGTFAAPWGGALISSIKGAAGTGTAVLQTDKTTYMPGTVSTASTTSPVPQQNAVAFLGYGFLPTTATAITTGNAALAGGLTPNADANGAVFSVSTLGDTPWSTNTNPTVAASYAPVVSQAGGPANFLGPSFTITPWIDTTKNGISSTTVDYQTNTETVKVHGFGATDTVTVTIGGTAMVSGGTVAATNGAGTTAAGQVPDLASGKQNVLATGSVSGQTATATGAVTYDPRVDSTVSSGALSINNGGAGQTSILRTGNGYGVHGLAANTQYTVMWNPISGGISLGTFTSTATGGIPVPGLQFTVPSDSSGIHLLDIQTSGNSAIYGSTKVGDYSPPEAPFNSSQLTTQYGDLIFNNIGLLSATPSVANIGSPELLSGSGLSAGTTYEVALSQTAGSVSVSAPALGSFVATSAGAVPSSTSITLTDTASTTETGTIEYFSVQTASHFGATTTSDAYAKFVLAASAQDNATSEPAGHAVTLTAHALNAGGVYSIIFNYQQSLLNPTVYTGTPVGIIAPSAVGAGSTSWNIPAAAQTGSYTVQLVVSTQGTGGLAVGSAVLDQPLTIAVGGVTGSCTNEGTGCMTAPSAPTETQVGANKAIQVSYTNNSNGPQTAIVYAVVHNAAGQTVAYTTATISPAAGGSQLAQLILFGLAPGTYSATVFATSTGGVALSTTSTVTVTI